jgi:ATP-dependent Zn protease
MAPKDVVPDQNESLQQRHLPSDDNEQETNADRKEDSWNDRLVKCLLRLLEKTSKRITSSTSDDDCDDAYESRRKIVVGVGATVLVLLGYRFRRRLRLLSPSFLVLRVQSLGRRPDCHSATEAPLSLLYHAINNKSMKDGQSQIQRAWIGSSGIFYLLDGVWKQSKLPTNSPGLQKDLMEQLSKSCRDVAVLPESLSSQLATPILAALPFVYLAFLYRMMRNLSGRDDDSSTVKTTDTTAGSTTTFVDVAGMDAVLPEVSEIVSYLRNPERYDSVGARPPRGVLLHGPPGGGKTLLARAVAGEAAVDSFVACSASDFVEVYVGQGAARVRSLFRRARQEAKQRLANRERKLWWRNQWMTGGRLSRSTSSSASPASRKACAIIFIDELDALAKTRSSNSWSSNDEREQTLNQLLTEMDGFVEDDSVTLIVMAASNRADVLDPAILRRMDRQIHVGYPDCKGREAIFKVHARRVQLCREPSVDFKHLASMSDNFSGADLRNAVNEAALLAVRDGCAVVQQNHLEHAVRRIRQMKNNLNTTESIPVGAIPVGFR